MKTRLVALLTFSALALAPVTALWAQPQAPPNTFHPYRGGVNCIQVADAQGNFNCAGGTKVDPATGNMVIGGTITFTGFAGGSATFFPGLVVGAIGSGAQVVGTADFVIATSPPTIAASGPLIQGVTFRVRQGPAGSCQLVVTGGNSFNQEFIIPVVPKSANFITLATGQFGYLQTTFPGGPAGC